MGAVYGTQAGMVATFGNAVVALISDDDRNGALDSAVVDAALKQASSIMDTFFVVADILPLVLPYPEVVEQCCYAIAGQNLRLPRDQGTEDSKLLYDNAMAWLKRVSDGVATVPGQDDGDDTTPDPGEPEMTSEPRAWCRDLARGVF